MKKIGKFLVASGLIAAMGLSFTACGPGEDIPEGFTSIKYYASYISTYTKEAFEEMVATYNETQGQTDKVVVTMQPSTSVLSYNNIIGQKGKAFDVVSVSTASSQFKNVVTRGDHFVHLEQYLNDEAKETLAWDQIPDSLKNIWRFNPTLENGKYHAGEGADLLAMPFGNAPQVLFYNTEIFAQMGVNVVSVNEERCGTGEYAKLMPHGYAEYVEAPVSGLNKSQNSAGEEVYKVFNNRIPMNWEELRCLARSFQRENPGKYGYMSEWWFNYGWSVGGDCIGWNSETKKYDFSIGDKDKNFLALNDVTVNGTSYTKGEVLNYEDMKWLRGNAAEYNKIAEDLYELPSMYEAFLEFNRLGIPTNKVAATDAGESGKETVNGYGVAKPTTTNRSREFTSGDSPMLCETTDNINSYDQGAISGKFDIAPLAQYREYEGGSVRTVDGEEYLNVIGANNWTGELKTVKNSEDEDVACCGEAITALSKDASALAIPKNIDPEKYDDAFKFISWACGPEGQTILSKGNTCIPNQANIGMSEEFNDSADRVIENQWAASFAFQNSFVGDWSYFNIETWINGWSGPLNDDVRRGEISLTKFINDYTKTAEQAISTMQIRIKGK